MVTDMKIKILGTGGAINDGLAYNSFIFNDDFLIETPPDVVNSIFREGLDRRKITTLYISHFHADHCFGLPFFLLRNFVDEYKTGLKITGPEGIETKVNEICTLAFGADHPMQKWMQDYVTCEEIKEGSEIIINSRYRITPVKMFHSPLTFGFTMEAEGKRIAYIADTYWEDTLIHCIKDMDIVLIDLNGERSDNAKVHISEQDLIEYALPNIPASDIMFYGTHLKENKTSKNSRIKYLKPGDEITV